MAERGNSTSANGSDFDPPRAAYAHDLAALETEPGQPLLSIFAGTFFALSHPTLNSYLFG